MPAGYAHYVFGEKVLEVLDPHYQDIIKRNINLYHIGVHGPDILFYYKTITANRVGDLGNYIHAMPAYSFFKDAKQWILKNQNDETLLAYIFGVIDHFVLDHACHGYIGEMERTLHLTHSQIESDLDRKILVNQGLNPLTTSLTKHIHFDMKDCEVIGPFYHAEGKIIEKSLNNLLFILSWLRAPRRIKRSFVYFIMKLGGVYEKYNGLLISYKENKKDKDCIEELTSRLDQNVLLAKRLIEEFLDNDLDEIYQYNFE